MTSLGLVVGCGDDGNNSSQTGVATESSSTTTTTTDGPPTGSTPTDASTAEPPTTSEGSGSMTSDSSGPTTTDTTTTTGMVTATMGSTETATDTSTTEPPETSSTTQDTASSDTDSTSSSSTSTSDTDTDTTDTTTTGDIPCNELQVVLTPVVPNVMLVLDKSGSMLSQWDHDANPATATVTRWFSLYAVVDQVLTAFNANFNFGMNLFPNKQAVEGYNVNACPVNANVEIPVAPFNKNAILGALPAQNNMTIRGGTPAAAGVTSALNHLKTLDPAIPRAIMLITDGAANCISGAMDAGLFEVYDQSLHTIVGNAFTMDQIPTYVIGIATSNAVTPMDQDGNPDNINPYVKLNELATAGGTAKPGPEMFYNANNQNELQAALNAIVSEAQSCVLPLDAEPGFPDFTKVKVDGAYVPKVADCANQSGWKYVDPAPPYTAIELCGTACDTLKVTSEAGVEYYCKPA